VPRTAGMDFHVDLAELVGAPQSHPGPCVGYVDERVLRRPSGTALCTVLEELGRRSAAAQGLKKPVTYGSSRGLGDQRVYLLVDGRMALGFLKVGPKRLFVAAPPTYHQRGSFADVQDAFREIEPQCALDFYIHERCQRSGLGRRLFDAMLAREKLTPCELGYDRPSPKLLGFLRKHYGLSDYRPQNNNFVVFDRFFALASGASGGSSEVEEELPLAKTTSVTPPQGGGVVAARRPSLGACGEEFGGIRHPSRASATSLGAASVRLHGSRSNSVTFAAGRDLRQHAPDLFAEAPAVHRRAAAAPIF